MSSVPKSPSRQDRLAVFNAVLPKLPLFEARALLYGETNRRVVPRVSTLVSIVGNIDDNDRMAKSLGVKDESFLFDQQEFQEGADPPHPLNLTEVMSDLVPRDRLASNDEIYLILHERKGDDAELVWHLELPLLTPKKDRACFSLQLGGYGGAVDYVAWAQQATDGWVLESWGPKK